MAGFKDVMKEGWHPKGKTGGKESWRGDFKGINQVAGWMGKGKDSSSEAGNHVSQPLSTLKDPSSFGPPPRRGDYHDGAATPNTTTRAIEEQAAKPAPPPAPYRVNTTGLPTANLPKPPIRSIRPGDGAEQHNTVPQKPKPSLPPRLPPRQNSTASPSPPDPPPPYQSSAPKFGHDGSLNTGSLNRLGKAGISVPGFNIGESNSWRKESSSSQNSTSNGNLSQLGGLQSRFSQKSTSPNPEPPSQGTTFSEKQAAFNTAKSFRNNPSSVSLADARSAASTANNFKQRHGDQVASGLKTANSMNQKYGIADKMNSFANDRAPPSTAGPSPSHDSPASPGLPGIGGKKKPPPPPPPKRRTFTSTNPNSSTPQPPPIPLARPTNGGFKSRQCFLFRVCKAWVNLRRLISGPMKNSGRVEEGNMDYIGVKVTWDEADPDKTALKGAQKYCLPPANRDEEELAAAKKGYGRAIVNYCEKNSLRKVGDGECWSLVLYALTEVGTSMIKAGLEPPFTSEGRTHGQTILTVDGSSRGSPADALQVADVGPGDVVDMIQAHFKSIYRRRPGEQGEKNVRVGFSGYHVVTIKNVAGSIMTVYEQNANGNAVIDEGDCDLMDLQSGTLKFMRPIGASWCPPMTITNAEMNDFDGWEITESLINGT
ncbi:MAG: hypothetical protein M1834_000154 [Cirrosporium novae-zelandiae]|nr:MAG: hypothetical protein M1834_000154 [Cirrosporium novae-zelandiae]